MTMAAKLLGQAYIYIYINKYIYIYIYIYIYGCCYDDAIRTIQRAIPSNFAIEKLCNHENDRATETSSVG